MKASPTPTESKTSPSETALNPWGLMLGRWLRLTEESEELRAQAIAEVKQVITALSGLSNTEQY
jgi:hypothetical protein